VRPPQIDLDSVLKHKSCDEDREGFFVVPRRPPRRGHDFVDDLRIRCSVAAQAPPQCAESLSIWMLGFPDFEPFCRVHLTIGFAGHKHDTNARLGAHRA
jgi:hypothetical protein